MHFQFDACKHTRQLLVYHHPLVAEAIRIFVTIICPLFSIVFKMFSMLSVYHTRVIHRAQCGIFMKFICN